MVSSHMPQTPPPSEKMSMTTGMSSTRRAFFRPNVKVMLRMTAVMAPVCWMTLKAPPTMKQDGDDGRGVDEAADGRDEADLPSPCGSLDDTGVGPGHGDRPAVLLDPLVLAARDDPGGDHGQDDHDIDEDERVGQAEGLAFHFDGSSTRPAARS